MQEARQTVVVVVKPGRTARRTSQVLKWVRWLVPAALLIVSAGVAPVADESAVITIDADSVESGPLSVADALARHQVKWTK